MDYPNLKDIPALLLKNLEAQEKIEKQLSHIIEKLNPDRKELLTISEVGALLNISRTTVWKWEKKGVLKSYGIESEKYFKRSEIIESLIPLNHE